MAGRYAPKTVLAHLIQRRNQTYSEIVAEFAELGGTITERHLRRLASGERAGTTPQTRRTLQRMFGKPVEELLAPYVPEQAAQVVPAPAASGRITTGNEMEVLDMAASRARAFSPRGPVRSRKRGHGTGVRRRAPRRDGLPAASTAG